MASKGKRNEGKGKNKFARKPDEGAMGEFNPRKIAALKKPVEIPSGAEIKPESSGRGWRVIGVVKGNELVWEMPGTRARSKNISTLPKVSGRKGEHIAMPLRRVIGLFGKKEVYKFPVFASEPERHIMERLASQRVLKRHTRVPEIEEHGIIKDLIYEGKEQPVPYIKMRMIGDARNLAQTGFKDHEEALDFLGNLVNWSTAALHEDGILYLDVKLENFAKFQNKFWVVDEEAANVQNLRKISKREIEDLGYRIGFLVADMIKRGHIPKDKIPQVLKTLEKNVYHEKYKNPIINSVKEILKKRRYLKK